MDDILVNPKIGDYLVSEDNEKYFCITAVRKTFVDAVQLPEKSRSLNVKISRHKGKVYGLYQVYVRPVSTDFSLEKALADLEEKRNRKIARLKETEQEKARRLERIIDTNNPLDIKNILKNWEMVSFINAAGDRNLLIYTIIQVGVNNKDWQLFGAIFPENSYKLLTCFGHGPTKLAAVYELISMHWGEHGPETL